MWRQSVGAVDVATQRRSARDERRRETRGPKWSKLAVAKWSETAVMRGERQRGERGLSSPGRARLYTGEQWAAAAKLKRGSGNSRRSFFAEEKSRSRRWTEKVGSDRSLWGSRGSMDTGAVMFYGCLIAKTGGQRMVRLRRRWLVAARSAEVGRRLSGDDAGGRSGVQRRSPPECVCPPQAWAARGLPPGLSWRPDHVMRGGRAGSAGDAPVGEASCARRHANQCEECPSPTGRISCHWRSATSIST